MNDSRPFLTADGTELWFTRDHQGSPVIFRSLKINSEWQEPELIISHFAGEPTLDPQRNIYFVHHFIIDGNYRRCRYLCSIQAIIKGEKNDVEGI